MVGDTVERDLEDWFSEISTELKSHGADLRHMQERVVRMETMLEIQAQNRSGACSDVKDIRRELADMRKTVFSLSVKVAAFGASISAGIPLVRSLLGD